MGAGANTSPALSLSCALSLMFHVTWCGQVSLMVALDFTGSNGHPSKPSSLHYMAPASSSSMGQRVGFNEYQQTIDRVGSILASYDADGRQKDYR